MVSNQTECSQRAIAFASADVAMAEREVVLRAGVVEGHLRRPVPGWVSLRAGRLAVGQQSDRLASLKINRFESFTLRLNAPQTQGCA